MPVPPLDKNFSEQLAAHLKFGTRPSGDPYVRGLPWLEEEFIEQLSKVSGIDTASVKKNLGHWLGGKSCTSRSCECITRVLFGENPAYAKWKHAFRLAVVIQRRDAKSPSSASDQNDFDFSVPITDLGTLKFVYKFDEDSYVDASGAKTTDIPFELFREWWEAFPHGFLCTLEDQVPVAVIGCFPVTKRWATSFLAGRVSEFGLNRKIIQESDSTHWYLSGLSKDQLMELSTNLPRILGHALIGWARIIASRVGNRDITIVSEGTTEIGQRLLRDNFRFTLERPAISAGEEPRFSTRTNVDQIRHILTNLDFFSRYADLQQAVAMIPQTLGR